MKESWHNYKDKVKRFARFGREELQSLIIASLAFSFIFSYEHWWNNGFDLTAGITSFALALVIVGISMYVHEMAHRLHALFI